MSIEAAPSINQDEQAVTVSNRSFFIPSELIDTPMAECSANLQHNYGPLMPTGSMELKHTSGEPTTEDYQMVAITAGFQKHQPKVMSWTLNFISHGVSEILVCDIDLSSPRQTHDFVTSLRYGEMAVPVEASSGISAVWQSLKSDDQGKLTRRGFISDHDQILSSFINRALDHSDAQTKLEYLKSEKRKAVLESRQTPRSYFDYKTVGHRAIGFVSSGLIDSSLAVPATYLNAIQRSESVLKINQLSQFVQELIVRSDLFFKAPIKTL